MQGMGIVLKGTLLAMCRDGRNDSPGHSAKYSVYTLMEHFFDVIMMSGEQEVCHAPWRNWPIDA